MFEAAVVGERKPVLALLMACVTALPVAGQLTRSFAPPGHLGADIAAIAGSEVRSVERGVIWFAGSVAGNRAVTVRLESGDLFTVSFLSSAAVVAGQMVERGTVLGYSGFAHGSPSVHVSARRGGEYIDPRPWLSCHSAGSTGTLRLLPPLLPWAYPSPGATRNSRRNVRSAPHGPPDPW